MNLDLFDDAPEMSGKAWAVVLVGTAIVFFAMLPKWMHTAAARPPFAWAGVPLR